MGEDEENRENRQDEVSHSSKSRSLTENSSGEGSGVPRKKVVRKEFKLILKFKKEDERVELSLIALSGELKKKLKGRNG